MKRFKNCKVLTLDGGCAVENKEVWTDGDRICFVGVPTDEQLKTAVFEKEYDLDGDLMIPAFKNAHTHSAMTFLRNTSFILSARSGRAGALARRRCSRRPIAIRCCSRRRRDTPVPAFTSARTSAAKARRSSAAPKTRAQASATRCSSCSLRRTSPAARWWTRGCISAASP